MKKAEARSRREFLQAGAALALAPGVVARAKETGFPLAICNETFEGWSFEKGCQGAREAGFTGLDTLGGVRPTLAPSPSPTIPRACLRGAGPS